MPTKFSKGFRLHDLVLATIIVQQAKEPLDISVKTDGPLYLPRYRHHPARWLAALAAASLAAVGDGVKRSYLRP